MISDIRIAPKFTTAAPPRAACSGGCSETGPSESVSRSSQTEQLQSLLAATASDAAKIAQTIGDHEPGEVIVRLKGGLGLDGDFASEYGATVAYKFDIPHQSLDFEGELVQLKLPAGMSTAQAMAAMAKDGRVEYAVPNHRFQLEEPQPGNPPTQQPPAQDPPAQQPPTTNVPNDMGEVLRGMNNTGQNGGKADADIDAPEAWTISTGNGSNNGPIIAVIDTGIDYNHPDLKDNMWTNPGEVAGDGIDNDNNGVIDDIHGYNAFADNGNPMDGHSHGTHCAGTIAGQGNNGEGVVGVNWDARLMGVKIFSDSGSTNAAAIIRGILYSTKMGARITSNSWGGGAANQAILDAFKSSPALHLMAAGNEGTDNDKRPHYPSNYEMDNNIAVAASDRNDNKAGFSCYGAKTVDIAAPGKDIYSSVNGGGYASYSGTSMATPHVAGVAGLVASAYPDASNAEIKNRILNGADKLPQWQGKVATGGRLNAANALENDKVAPGSPDDLQAIDSNPNGVTLNWTATGDDGAVGTASGYELRYSNQPISLSDSPAQGEVPFESATLVETGAPQPAGSPETTTIGLTPSSQERELFYGLKVVDNAGNASGLVTGSVRVPAADLAFEDTLDADAANWSSDGSWAQVDVPGRGKVFTDSPDGQYGSGANTSLTSRPISLANFSGSTLLFDATHQLENNYDKVNVEVSDDGGQNWARPLSLTGESGWSTHKVDLSAFDGKDVQVRFNLTSDGSVNGDGFSLDNVLIAGKSTPPPQQPPAQDPPAQQPPAQQPPAQNR